MVDARRALKYGAGALGVVVVLAVIGFLTGLLGVPAVETVENRFASVNDSTTTIDTDLTVSNPNPIGVSLGGLSVDYGIAMNDVAVANGSKEGVSIGSGETAIPFRTHLVNERIPEWWYTHVSRGEVTDVLIDVDLSHSLLGGQTASLPQRQTIETDIIGQFNDSTTRPIAAGAPIVSDPVLYLNLTAAWYGDDLTPARTPMNMSFTVFNPKAYHYTVSEIGYEIRMNGIVVGEGASERPRVIPARESRTLSALTVIRNDRLDEWWVSHLERDQVTNLTVDFYLVVDPEDAAGGGGAIAPFRIDSSALDYTTTIETDIFGTKASDGLPPNGTDSGDGTTNTPGASTATASPTSTPDGTDTASPTPTPTGTPTPTEGLTPTDTPTPTEGPTPTETDDGILG
jgi:LEA14-like dessication related protein